MTDAIRAGDLYDLHSLASETYFWPAEMARQMPWTTMSMRQQRNLNSFLPSFKSCITLYIWLNKNVKKLKQPTSAFFHRIGRKLIFLLWNQTNVKALADQKKRQVKPAGTASTVWVAAKAWRRGRKSKTKKQLYKGKMGNQKVSNYSYMRINYFQGHHKDVPWPLRNNTL